MDGRYDVACSVIAFSTSASSIRRRILDALYAALKHWRADLSNGSAGPGCAMIDYYQIGSTPRHQRRGRRESCTPGDLAGDL